MLINYFLVINITLKVLYDDGDVEVLCLDKERWELIENGHKSTKVCPLTIMLKVKPIDS